MSTLDDAVKRLRAITSAVREADIAFKHVGGSSRHWVNECFLPALEEKGLEIVDRARVAALTADLAARDERIARLVGLLLGSRDIIESGAATLRGCIGGEPLVCSLEAIVAAIDAEVIR